MTLPRLFALYSVWQQYPPVIVAAAALLGLKPGAATSAPAKPETFAEASRRLALATTADPNKLQWITVPNPQRLM
jgi:hypothetical protein